MSKRSFDEDQESSTKRHKENQEGRLEVRLLIDGKLSGGVIGKGGEEIKKLREQSGGWINMGDSARGAPLRVVTAQGDVEAATNGCILLCARLVQCEREFRERKGEEDKELAHEAVFLIPNAQVGCVIGKGGAQIKVLRESAGGMVKISDDYLEGSDEKTLTLRGTEEQVNAGIRIVIDILDKHRDRRIPSQPYTGAGALLSDPYGPPPGNYGRPPPGQGYGYGPPSHHDPRGGYGGPPPPFASRGGGRGSPGRAPPAHDGRGGYQGGAGFPPADQGPAQTIIIPVPDYLTGTVIGKGGCNIKDIRGRSGAQVRVNDLETGATDRMVTITGSRGANEVAVALVYEYMSTYEPREPRA
jgi:transcription antitermination factor NusA-like protein